MEIVTLHLYIVVITLYLNFGGHHMIIMVYYVMVIFIPQLRFMDEIMYMIQCLKNQLHNQRESVGKLYQFTINETGMSSSYNNLKKQVQQTLARVSLMLEILEKDLEWYGDGDEETLLPELMQELAKKEGEVLVHYNVW